MKALRLCGPPAARRRSPIAALRVVASSQVPRVGPIANCEFRRSPTRRRSSATSRQATTGKTGLLPSAKWQIQTAPWPSKPCAAAMCGLNRFTINAGLTVEGLLRSSGLIQPVRIKLANEDIFANGQAPRAALRKSPAFEDRAKLWMRLAGARLARRRWPLSGSQVGGCEPRSGSREIRFGYPAS
jgi:hypothetical protein